VVKGLASSCLEHTTNDAGKTHIGDGYRRTVSEKKRIHWLKTSKIRSPSACSAGEAYHPHCSSVLVHLISSCALLGKAKPTITNSTWSLEEKPSLGHIHYTLYTWC
jgi:hypothetical protein